ncbi:hypothetical protein [Lonsdalea quercina]|uniref:hypothetical protein n=1 Tax=Lonsdalea quercina TaxID=71657 RepID=UPI00047E2BAE|nr:hypothetical protein [Lonsdalea quercina]
MKKMMIDAIGLTGLGLLVGGIYQQFGTAIALQCAGAALLVFALIAARRGKP